ncbi:MAG: TldD/PmbA family protein [Parasynechococcus sp.]|jgi:PmbA protein|uniref:TldD/PmbA family protein n=1 Tax=Parasynechococcus sp. TaxID=3101203 RepID=UPI000E18B832|nr:TldD/PmbA family protein [bacterium]RCL57706.1 MAG: TldD/PmbA family protein [Synechococcus sp. MED-G69]|tara:strand:- start:4330 stop:5697 length:1368 start_codon:yes stop_codon:yes gene_type:complete
MATNNGLNASALRDSLQKLATREGISSWDLGAACSDDCSVQVDRGEAKQLKASQRSSITVRVWNKDGLVGITSTTDLSDAGLEQALVGAHEASRFGNPDDIPHFSPLAKAPLPELNRPLQERRGILPLLETLREAEADLLSRHPSIQTVPYNGLAESLSQSLYLNSDGALREMERTQASLYLYARAEEAGRKPRSGGALRVGLGSAGLDIAGCIDEAVDRTVSHLAYQPIETGTYNVCFTPEAFLSLIGAFSSIFNARSVLDGVSLSKRESIGETLAVPFLSLHDDGLHPGHISAAPFDGEGTPTKNLCLINRGILKSFLHSEATARAFDVQPTGHAGLGAKVSVGPDWFVLGTSEGCSSGNTLDQSNEKDTFVLIEDLSALHAGVKATQGSFSLPFDGWLVKGGERISVEAATVAGDIRTVLNSILHLESNCEVTHRGISPHVWVEGLSITGEA